LFYPFRSHRVGFQDSQFHFTPSENERSQLWIWP
jgi:hypothetical protein